MKNVVPYARFVNPIDAHAALASTDRRTHILLHFPMAKAPMKFYPSLNFNRSPLWRWRCQSAQGDVVIRPCKNIDRRLAVTVGEQHVRSELASGCSEAAVPPYVLPNGIGGRRRCIPTRGILCK